MVVAGDILVVGAGRSGLAAAALAVRSGLHPTLVDDKQSPDELPDGVRFVPVSEVLDGPAAGSDYACVVVSPGVPRDHPLLVKALGRGIDVISEIAFAAQRIDARIAAVTGTNGKSTVVSLVATMCRRAGRRTFVGGNLGNPLSEAAGEKWDECVVEVSSFQLEWPGTFHPFIGAVLNVSPDHLDRHGDMATYVETKMRLFASMGSKDHAVFGRGQQWAAGRMKSVEAAQTSFGLDALAAGQCGTRAIPGERRIELVGDERESVALSANWPQAPHDFENAAAAAEIARLLGIEAKAIQAALQHFAPLPHRLALVRTIGGVEYWNDSKATNVGATRRSLEAFSQPVILLAGGASKGASFAELADSASQISSVIAYGEAATEIDAALGGAVPVSRKSTMAEALGAAASAAKAGTVVLLAPACASFDEFSSYAERGKVFERLVGEIARRGD